MSLRCRKSNPRADGKPKALWETYNILQEKERLWNPPPAIWVDWVELGRATCRKQASEGRARARILTDNLAWIPKRSESERARKILSASLSLTAFRQVRAGIPNSSINSLALFKTRRNLPVNLLKSLFAHPLSVILASPGFLYLDEPKLNESKRTLTDRELAVRLAYFLWSAPPDAELFGLAKRNELSEPSILRRQVDRMIADPRSDEFVAGFVHQWLDMERLDFFQFDTKLHRDFDESVRSSAREEVYQSFGYLMRDEQEGQLGKLLKSDYVMINGLLSTYYGIEGVTGDEFRKVSLPADSPRGGLLGTAAVLAMGSDGIESSPVERGAWVLRYLLNDPPPPAPPNVPQISRLSDQVLTTRERLLAHQEDAQCASCHRKIDPIGFGLENFNASGKWRAEDSDGSGRRKKTWKIDASGAIHKGPGLRGLLRTA